MKSAFRLEHPLFSRETLVSAANALALYVGIYLVYVTAASICLNIHATNTFAAMLWAPIGIALVVLTMYGYRFAPPIALAAFTVNLYLGAGPLTAIFIAIGNTAAPLFGAYVLRKYVDFKPPRLRLRDNTGLILVAFLISVITATVGVGSLWLGGSITSAMTGVTWATWWFGDALGILVFAPLLFKWLYWPLRERTRLEHLELWAAILSVAAISFFIFWTPNSQFAYYLFIPLTWAALRTGPRGMTLAIFLGTVIAIGGTIAGFGPFATHGLFNLQIFVGTIAVLYLTFSAIVEERSYTLRKSEVHINELEHALRRISSEDEAKKEFLAVLAHELRNPLAAVLSSVELLKLEGVATKEAPVHLKAIGEHVHAMAGLLDDLLDISRISKKKFKLRKEVIPLGPIIERSAHSAQRLMQSLGHTLTVTREADEMFVEADPMRLEQVVVNLLNNAAKYTDPHGQIEVIAAQDGAMAVIRVRDTGVGIPNNMLTRIFEPFFQLEQGKATNEGLGIGLALTRQLVEMHGGTIEAQSPGEGLGSEFTVRLPSASATRARPAAPVPKNKNGKQVKNSLRILVVDDNRAAADALSKLLTLRGQDVQTAYSAQEAIERSIELDPHVVILDIGLPDLDGYEVARRLRKKKFGGAIIALTGYGQESDKEKARNAGFQFHLTKPVGLKDVEAVLRKISPHT
ncbi:MAG: MASE1 domain-containing protein [Patescibacteria group bacterium]